MFLSPACPRNTIYIEMRALGQCSHKICFALRNWTRGTFEGDFQSEFDDQRNNTEDFEIHDILVFLYGVGFICKNERMIFYWRRWWWWRENQLYCRTLWQKKKDRIVAILFLKQFIYTKWSGSGCNSNKILFKTRRHLALSYCL